jgi:putative peptide-modifying radical SAM enzyme
VYRRVIENLKLLETKGFEGELIARMTVSVGTEIDREVIWLNSNREFPFRCIHWQLDALFWQSDFDRNQFQAWSEGVYNPGVMRLVKMWVERMEMCEEVLKLYPILGVMRSLLLDEKSKLRCGAGWNTFNIQTDGRIVPCPVMAGMKDFYLGNIWDSDPLDLKDSVFVGKPCSECEAYNLCGGRCLYANATKLWGEEGYKLVCKTTVSFIDCLRKVEPRVRKLLSDGKVKMEDFSYQRYNSCEIIP